MSAVNRHEHATGPTTGLKIPASRPRRQPTGDGLAVELVVESGWHPCGRVDFFTTMLTTREDRPRTLESLFASHPLTEDRIRDVEAHIEALPAGRLAGLRTDAPACGPLTAALAEHPPPPGTFRGDEKREPGEGAAGEGPGQIPERTGVCAAR